MKTKLPLLISFALYLNINAQIGFQERTILGDETNNYDPITTSVLGDIDKDGDMDIIYCTSNKIGWYENTNKLRRFGGENIISINVKGVRSIFVSDLDGDGDLDVISASNDDDKIAWYENLDGNGNFGSQKIISTSINGARSVLATDIDNDGDLDIISGSYLNGIIYLHENIDGLGNFGNPMVIANDGVMTVYATDFDSDGDMDILSGSAYSTGWYENLDGKGAFGAQQSIASNDGVITMVKVKASDLDNDGDMDVITSIDSRYGVDKITWYENTNGLGVFGTEHVISDIINDPTFLNIADIDKDGYMDIISATTIFDLVNNTTSDSEISWYKNINGSGSFDSKQVITTYIDNPTSVHVIDINNDGDTDVISTSSTDAKIAWYENYNGLGNFGIQQVIAGITGSTWVVLIYDIDGDEDLDVLSASKGYNTVAWYENLDGQGNFSSQKTITDNAINVQSVYAADLDGDGDLDVLSASRDDWTLAWYENLDGKGRFGLKRDITSFPLVSLVCAADFDNDGDIDVVAASEDVDNVKWFENLDGLGDFSVDSNNLITPNAAGIKSLNTGDIDSDGDLDILFAHSDQGYGYIGWAENNNGLQYRGYAVANLDGANSALVEDIDGDGKMDIVASANSFSGLDKIVWYKSIDGLGDFETNPKVLNSNANGASSVYPADMDNDGDIDIVSASVSSSKIAWYENLDGLGSFTEEKKLSSSFPSYQPPRTVYCADLNNDGNLDIVSASQSLGPIVWYENLGALGNIINGAITFDENKDGCDSNDLKIPNIMVTTNNSTNSFATFTNYDGNYLIYTNAGDFTSSIATNIPDYYTITPSSHSSNFIGLNNSDIANFCLELTQAINVINITLLPTRGARPGFDASYQLVYHNVGTSQLSGDVILEFDNSKLTFLNTSEIISSQTPNSLTFNYSNLNPFETRTIDLKFNVFTPPTTNIGDILTFTATISPVSGDNTESNNLFELNQTVIGSYDPNDIAVLEGNQIFIGDVDEYLHYIIRFQNTGTASAINVKVDNLLDAKLDWTTLQIESSSHTNRVEIIDGNEVSFIFNGIYLPDSTTDESNSHGFIAYKIKPKSDVIVGDIMPNQADIFFDFNPAIVTNIVTTEITSSLGIGDSFVSKFYLYPNPTKNVLNIQSKTQITKLEVYNNVGQIVVSELNKTVLDVSMLSTGIYFIKIKDEIGNSETKKFIKK